MLPIPDPMRTNGAYLSGPQARMTDAYGRMRNMPAPGPANFYVQKPGPGQPIAGGGMPPQGFSLAHSGGVGGGTGGMPAGYVNPTGAGGFPPGYDASNAPMFAQYLAAGGAPWGSNGSGNVGQRGGNVGVGGGQSGYGYGTTPGSGPGYYEQQTPAGSFVAGQVNTATGRPDLSAATASNPYIGMTSGQAAGQAPTMGYGAAAARYATGANPYLGQTTAKVGSAGSNAYAGANPFLQQQINATTADATKAFNDVVNPQFDRMAQASGSFGNTGVEAARSRALGEFGQNLGNTISGMRMQDYSNQQQLAESALNRNQQVNLANAGFNAGDLNRNMGGYLQGQGLGLQGLGMQQAGAQFDANLGQGLNTFNAGLGQNDLTRNANLSQNLGQFNASALNNMGQFNQSQGNSLSMFNAGQANNMGQFNAAAGNSMLENFRNRQQRGSEFDQNMDFNTWMANNQNMRNGNRDTIDFLNTMMGWQNQGVNAATNVQNTPLNYFNQFQQMLNQFAGNGGTSTQNLQGNPLMAFIGALTGLYGNGTGRTG